MPGPVPDPTSSRWVVDTRSGATVLFTWFPDDRVAVASVLCSRFGEWAYELNFYYGVTEGTLPAKVRRWGGAVRRGVCRGEGAAGVCVLAAVGGGGGEGSWQVSGARSCLRESAAQVRGL